MTLYQDSAWQAEVRALGYEIDDSGEVRAKGRLTEIGEDE